MLCCLQLNARSAPRIGNGIILHSPLIIYDKKHKNVQVGNQGEGSVRVKLSVVAEVHIKMWTMTYKCGGRADADTWCHTVQVLRDSCTTPALLQPVNGRTALKHTFYAVLYFRASLKCCHSICPCWTSANQISHVQSLWTARDLPKTCLQWTPPTGINTENWNWVQHVWTHLVPEFIFSDETFDHQRSSGVFTTQYWKYWLSILSFSKDNQCTSLVHEGQGDGEKP